MRISMQLPRARSAQRPTEFVAADSPAARQRAAVSYARLPLSFERNQGQTDSQVKFLSRDAGYSLFLTGTGDAVLALHKSQTNDASLS